MGLINYLEVEEESPQVGPKLHRVHLSPKVNKRASAPFELVHYDVWGPCPVFSSIAFKYVVTFVDDFSPVTWFYLMKSRFELFFSF